MTCTRCKHDTCKRFGTYGKRRIQRWRCNSCNATFCQPHPQSPLGAMRTSEEAAARAGRSISGEHFGVSIGYASAPIDAPW